MLAFEAEVFQWRHVRRCDLVAFGMFRHFSGSDSMREGQIGTLKVRTMCSECGKDLGNRLGARRVGFLLGPYWVPIGFISGSYWVSLWFLSRKSIWCAEGWVPIGFPLGPYWFPTGFLLGSCWIPIGFLLGSFFSLAVILVAPADWGLRRHNIM